MSSFGTFTVEDQRTVHRAASQLVSAAVLGETLDRRTLLGDLGDRLIDGVFVTLKRGTTLRGCCGTQGAPAPLSELLAEASLRTATQDPRMPSVAAVELPYLQLSITLLGPYQKVAQTGEERLGAFTIGRHGLRIRSGRRSGLLLPSVATEHGWNERQFLDAVCRKAGMAPGLWRSDDVQLDIFEGSCFSDAMAGKPRPEALGIGTDAVRTLQEWVQFNLRAFANGTTPLSCVDTLEETDVAGVVLAVRWPESCEVKTVFELDMLQAMPLQATLFRLTMRFTSAIDAGAFTDRPWVRVAVLDRPVHHGSIGEVDVRGIAAELRAVIATDGRHWSLHFDRDATIGNTIRIAMGSEPFRHSELQIYSVACASSECRFRVSTGPRGDDAMTERAPGVAGVFYPQDDDGRHSLVDRLISETLPGDRQRCLAAMVPHAALHYSGRVAAEVWNRLQIPERVVIIGPKHRRDGLDWAVAPHKRWQLSDTESIVGDADLAREIADAVPNMELDSAAHREEHSIEVQLPILHRVAPDTRIAAIAMHGGGLAELEAAAEAFADWLRRQDEPPLLVISSDMNHFADDQENRRRDRLALDALSSGDAEELLSVCVDENISMCGRIPAAFVLLTLKALGKEPRYREIAYATSADVSGDTSRVVGYAGVLL